MLELISESPPLLTYVFGWKILAAVIRHRVPGYKSLLCNRLNVVPEIISSLRRRLPKTMILWIRPTDLSTSTPVFLNSEFL